MAITIGGLTLEDIHKVETAENARFIFHPIPGMNGSVSQNLGRTTVKLLIEGIFYGPQRQQNLNMLRYHYLNRQPLDFITDVVAQAYVGKVIIEFLDVSETAEYPFQFTYCIIISEYVRPSLPVTIITCPPPVISVPQLPNPTVTPSPPPIYPPPPQPPPPPVCPPPPICVPIPICPPIPRRPPLIIVRNACGNVVGVIG